MPWLSAIDFRIQQMWWHEFKHCLSGANLDATSEAVELIAILESDLILLDKDLKTKTYLPKKKVMMIYI